MFTVWLKFAGASFLMSISASYMVTLLLISGLSRLKILLNGMDSITEPMRAVGTVTSWATIFAPDSKLKLISPFNFASTLVCSMIAFSIMGLNPFRVIIDGTIINANKIAAIIDTIVHTILRLCLGFNAILSSPCILIIMDYTKCCEQKNI